MISVKLIAVGNLKEPYLRDAVAEYEKRLSGFCRFETVQLREERLPEDPSAGEIRAALEKEGQRIEEQIPPRAYRIAMCVEGVSLSSEEFAAKLEKISDTCGEICFIIGSSFGLADTVKQKADLKLSVSRLTFPHQLMRVILMEAIYRAFHIQRGTRYHK